MLKLYENIKERRLELGLTQTQLADKLGYADKSMIAKIEKGQIDLPQSKIMAFARVLLIDPGMLMGWDEPSSSSFELSRDEIQLIKMFRCLNAAGRQKALNDMRDTADLDRYIKIADSKSVAG